MRATFALILGLALLLGVPGAARAADAGSATQPPAAGTPPSGAGFSMENYILGPTDKLKISVYGEEGLTGEYVVSADGKVSLPLVGNVSAAGLTVKQFQDQLVVAYRDGYLQDPKITAEVETARPFFILGEVKTPGQYPCLNGLTVLNAIATAGGFTYRAVTDQVYVRHADQTQEVKEQLTTTTPVYPGDTIRIEERWF